MFVFIHIIPPLITTQASVKDLFLWGSEFHQKVVFQRNTSADLEKILNTVLLSEKRIYDWGFVSGSWGLAQVTQNAQHIVESVEIGFVIGSPLDSFQKLGEEDQVQDDWDGQEGVFADIVDAPGLFTSQEDLRNVFIDGFLGVSGAWDVFNDDFVVWMASIWVQVVVGSDDIISTGLLCGFLGLKLAFGTEVLAVVVSEMVVTDNRDWLETSASNNFDQSSLELGLTSLEVVSDNEDVVLDSQLNDTVNEGVLWASVDEADSFESSGSSVDDGWGDFWVIVLNSLQEVISGIVDTNRDLAESFGVCGPHNNNFIELVLGLEGSNVFSDLFEVLLLVVSWKGVISSVLLVGSDEIFVVNSWVRNYIFQVWCELGLEVIFDDLGSSHGVSQVHFTDVPTTNNDIVGVNKGQDLVQSHEDFRVLVVSDLGGGRLGDGAQIVWLVGASL